MARVTSQLKVFRGDLDPEADLLLRKSSRISWDIETDGLDYRRSRIGTCQLYSETAGGFLVQITDELPSRLCGVLTSPRVEKVFHYAPFDLRFMRYHWDVRSTNVACTKIASRILFPSESSAFHSLQKLLESQLDVEIDKGVRVSDWLAEKLTSAQREYAFNDVAHLLNLYDSLMSKARNRGLADIVESSFSYLPTRVETDLLEAGDVFAYSKD